MNTITRDTIDLDALQARAHHPQAGAMLLFCGDIRNHNESKAVVALEYEAQESMALKQIDEIVAEACRRWEAHYVEVIHRLGYMRVSESSIAITVATSHRKDCYSASRFIIDTIKHSVPIWKKEHFIDGSSQWSKGCEACGIHELNHHDSSVTLKSA